MDMSDKMKQQVSQAVDADLSDEELRSLLQQLRGEQGDPLRETWDQYHMIGDVLRSDELDVQLSENFTSKLMSRIDAEPTVLLPKSVQKVDAVMPTATAAVAPHSRYMAITSIAAAVMVAFVMAPQIIATFQAGSGMGASVAKLDPNESFSASVRLASNSAKVTNPVEDNTNRIETAGTNSKQANAKDAEFTQKLETQVEMLRDPRLDSYLQAHQKVSPTFDSGARHIQRANVVAEPSEK